MSKKQAKKKRSGAPKDLRKKRKPKINASRISLRYRRCPNCGNKLSWEDSESHPKGTPNSKLRCRDDLQCGWHGRLYDSLPIPKESAPETAADAYAEFLADYRKTFELLLDGNNALADFEAYLLNHPKGDPDPRGHATTTSYMRKLSQLRILRSLIRRMDLAELEEGIMRREVAFLFPIEISKPRKAKGVK